MRSQAGVVILLVVLAVVAAPALAAHATPAPVDGGGPTAVPGTDIANATTENGTNESNVSLGGQLSAFLQSNEVQANATVENGMWRAQVTRGNDSNATKSIENRIQVLERRQQQLQSRLDRFDNRSVKASDPAGVAEMARLSTQIQTLQSSVNETGDVAARVGVNTTRLETLRNNASNLAGHEVAKIARNLSIGPPRGPPGGPPGQNDRGPGKTPPGSANGNQPGANQTDESTPGKEHAESSDQTPNDNQHTERDSSNPSTESPAGNETAPPGND